MVKKIVNDKKDKSANIGFWLRFLASAVDQTIISILSWVLSLTFVYSPVSSWASMIIVFILIILVDAVYEIWMTYKFGGTVGKLLIKCRVVDENNNNITLGTSIGRYFAKILSGITLCIGFLMIAWDEKKQGLHDKIVKTWVVYDNKSKVSDKLRKIVIILSIIGIVIYTIYMVLSLVFGMVIGFKAATQPVDVNDTMASLNKLCDYRMGVVKDSCITIYALSPNFPASYSLDACNLVRTKSLKAECVSRIAAQNRNDALCASINSGYYERICHKEVLAADKIMSWAGEDY